MSGGPLRRLLTGALLADASFVIGHRGGGRFDISAIAWAAPRSTSDGLAARLLASSAPRDR